MTTTSSSETAEIFAGGIVVVIAAVFLAYSAGVLGWFGDASGVDRYRVSLISARGVQEGTDVRVAGVQVGRVEWLALNPETFAAETELAITSDFTFPDDSLAVVSTEGLLGGTFVEIIPGRSSFELDPGGRFRTAEPETGLIDLLLGALDGRR